MASAEAGLPPIRPVGPDAVRLLQITDTHLFADPDAIHGGVNVDTRFQTVISAMRPWAEGANALVHTGDLVHDGSQQGYARLAAALQSLNLPGVVMPGNHDDRRVLERVFAATQPRAARQVTIGTWSVIALDTQVAGDVAGHLADSEMAAFEAALADCPATHIVVALHHPPVAVGTPWLDAIGLDNADALHRQFEADPRIRGCLFGHVHMPWDSSRGGVRMLATPATAVQFAAGAETFTLDAGPPGFRWIDLLPDGGIETDVVRVPVD